MKSFSKKQIPNFIKLDTDEFPENLYYPASDDIFNKDKKESDLDPEDILKKKNIEKIEGSSKNNEKDFEEDVSGNDLDVPGSELDDNQEYIGSEDEENNFYSIGGDNHNNLEEDDGIIKVVRN